MFNEFLQESEVVMTEQHQLFHKGDRVEYYADKPSSWSGKIGRVSHCYQEGERGSLPGFTYVVVWDEPIWDEVADDWDDEAWCSQENLELYKMAVVEKVGRYDSETKFVKVRCPYCGRLHTHGYKVGRRAPHCAERPKLSSYYELVDPKGLMVL